MQDTVFKPWKALIQECNLKNVNIKYFFIITIMYGFTLRFIW